MTVIDVTIGTDATDTTDAEDAIIIAAAFAVC